MFRNALQEVRLHPGRIIATLISIAISVAFMVAVSVFMTTEQSGLAKMYVRQNAGADVVVQLKDGQYPDDPEKALAENLAKVKSSPQVQAAESPKSTYGTLTHDTKNVNVALYEMPSPDFRWAKLREGAWPTKPNDIALTPQVAKDLGLGVGGSVKLGNDTLTVTGISDDPKSLLMQVGYVGPGREDVGFNGTIIIKGKSGVSTDQLITDITPLLSKEFQVVSRDTYEQSQLKQLTGDVDATKTALQVFAAISVLVGMIIIANTFTILITQRRRQIGLLRAIGASTSQIRRQFLAEALIIGTLGSALGVLLGTAIAAAGNWFTGSIYWGLAFPIKEIIPEFLVGVVITVLAAIVPVWRTSKVKPLEALQPVLSADSAKKVSKVRLIICAIFAVIGIALVVTTFMISKWQILPALAAAFFLTFAVLGAAPLYVAALIRLLGKLFAWTGPTARLATTNASRNPQRAAATAVALMLAVGLIVTLQVGTSTVRSTVVEQVDQHYPIDLMVTAYDEAGLPEGVIKQVDALPGVQSKVTLNGGQLAGDNVMGVRFLGVTPESREVAAFVPESLADDTAIVSKEFVQYVNNGNANTFVAENGKTKVTLKLIVAETGQDDSSVMMVNEATLKKLVAKPVPTAVWLKLTDRNNLADTMAPLGQIQQTGGVAVSGGAATAYIIGQVLNMLLLVTTALLAVAVAIALIGVANTLGLSVVERTRESALLRALGMKRSRLRLMLLIEAIELALVGVIVGVVAGTFFGWFGVTSVLKMAGIPASDIKFGIDPSLTIGLIVIAVVMASLASILPGRRAAMATPTEALAVD